MCTRGGAPVLHPSQLFMSLLTIKAGDVVMAVTMTLFEQWLPHRKKTVKHSKHALKHYIAKIVQAQAYKEVVPGASVPETLTEQK